MGADPAWSPVAVAPVITMEVDGREPSPSVDMEMGARRTSIDDEDPEAEHARPRKRTRRACDKCSTSRTRCDGECPCRRCGDYGYTCRYNREVKKRGRVPAASSAASTRGSNNDSSSDPSQQRPIQELDQERRGSSQSDPPLTPHIQTPSTQFPKIQHEHRGSMVSMNGRPPMGHIVGSPPAANGANGQDPITNSRPGPYLPSPSFGSIQLSAIVEPMGDAPLARHAQDSPPHLAHAQSRPNESDVLVSDESVGYGSPANGNGAMAGKFASNAANEGGLFPTVTANRQHRSSYSTSTAPEGSIPEMHRINSLYRAPSGECRYKCLDPVLPYLRDIIPASVAADLLDVYLTEPGSSLFRTASPYILTRIFRKKSLLHPTHPRPTTPALLATMLWCSAQTADIVLLHVPGSRAKITNALYELATSLISERDPDRWRRIHGGLRVESEQQMSTGNQYPNFLSSVYPTTTATNEPAGVIDDVLTFILLSIAVSGGDFKSDCFKWWSKAIRLTLSLRLNREDERCSASVSPCANPLCSCRRDQEDASIASAEAREERRRVFWLLFCLDRHLALSFNNVLYIPDSYCEIYSPLPETVWENLDTVSSKDLPARVLGPPTTVSGTGFFEYFLPLMAILGDIIEVHHRRQHPRLGYLDDSHQVAVISEMLATCERSLDSLSREMEVANFSTSGPSIHDLVTGMPLQPASNTTGATTGSTTATAPTTAGLPPNPTPNQNGSASQAHSQGSRRDRTRLQLVAAYSAHILHVLHVLLHGKWDAICMLDDDGDWITSARFNDCASHAIAASQAVSRILESDPELTFMPYLFGIYLLHGSFILLLFADRMPQLGPNQSVEQACETIIRAHEVCVVTLSTEFQKNFRKVLRSTLYSVRGSSHTEWEEHKARRRALSLYRWTQGAKGLAL